MATIQEAQLLNDAIDGLTRTLLQNRMMREQAKEREDKSALDRQMLNLRTQDLEDQRSNRAAALAAQKERYTAQGAHEQRMESYQEQLKQIAAENKALQAKHYEEMRQTGVLNFLRDGLRDGTIDVDAMQQQFADSPFLKDLGLGVQIFKSPEPKIPRAAGRVTWKPDPTNPDAGMVPTITEDLDAEGLQNLIRKRIEAQARPDNAATQRMREIDQKILKHEMALANGDQASGIGSLNPFGNWPGDRTEQIKALKAERARLEPLARGGVPGPAPAPEPETSPAAQPPAASPAPSGSNTNSPPATAQAPAAAPPTFQTEADARSAGYSTGQVVRLIINGRPTRVRLK